MQKMITQLYKPDFHRTLIIVAKVMEEVILCSFMGEAMQVEIINMFSQECDSTFFISHHILAVGR